MREAWTDDRLDDLSRKVGEGFQRMDARFDAMETRIDQRLDGLQRTLIVTQATFIAGLLGLFATQL